MNAWHGFDVVPAAMPYYERADLMSAISDLRVKIEEWSGVEDALNLVRAAGSVPVATPGAEQVAAALGDGE